MDPGERSRSSCHVLRDSSELASVAGRHVESSARRCIERTGRFSLVLSGGSTPAPVYELIAARARIDWNRVHVFWSDERCVPRDDEASNYRMAAATLFRNGAPPPGQIHRIPAERGAVEAAALYDDELAGLFGARRPASLTAAAFDLVLLGMGVDGHTASLFPGGSELSAQSWAAPARAPVDAEARERVTLTLAAISAATEVCFLVTGPTKRDIVARVLSNDAPDLPAARVRARRRVHWLLDGVAADGGGGRG